MLTFGVEIEFHCPALTQINVATAVTAGGVECTAAGYTHHRFPTWKVVSDGSLGIGGHEVVSPVLTIDRIDEIDRVCAALSGIRATVNRSCGLHVHIGATHLNVNALKRLAALYAEGESVIDSLLPPSRRVDNNNYSRSVRNLDAAALARATAATEIAQVVSGSDRHSKLNYTAFWRHGTVEFRQHSGTVDPVKIKSWVQFCLKMVETADREQGTWSAPATAYTPTTSAARSATNLYWRRGRRTRIIFNMLSRPEGATAEEVRSQLDVRARPDIRWHLERATAYGPARFTTNRSYSRGGTVFTLRDGGGSPAPVQAVTVIAEGPRLSPITTLDALLDKLQLTDTERTYWIERAAMLSAAHE